MSNRPHQDPKKDITQDRLVFSGLPKARIVWLRQSGALDEKAQQVYDAMTQQGLDLVVADALTVSTEELESADLVLLDAFDKVDGTVETVVARIRVESRVPLIMLTEGYSTEQLINALSAGADAIWSLNTPVDVLIVRCRALLRRWLSS